MMSDDLTPADRHALRVMIPVFVAGFIFGSVLCAGFWITAANLVDRTLAFFGY